jgi:hypothetical protein
MQPFAGRGFYPNYDTDANPDQVVNAFGPEKYKRLAAIKGKYDPDNVFLFEPKYYACCRGRVMRADLAPT